MGEEKLQALLQEGLGPRPRRSNRPTSTSVIVDTTEQAKNVMFPTDARLLNRAHEILVRLAKRQGLALRQSYAREGKFAKIKHQRYAHAKQFKRKDRLEVSIKHYRLKNSDREDLIKHLLRGLEASSSSGTSAKDRKGKEGKTAPIKETKLPLVGD